VNDYPNLPSELYSFYKFDLDEAINTSYDSLVNHKIDVFSKDRELWDMKNKYYETKKKKAGFFKMLLLKNQLAYCISKNDVLEIVVESIKRQIKMKHEFYGINLK
jgi:hypothetical protein